MVNFILAYAFYSYFHTTNYDSSLGVFTIERTPNEQMALCKVRYAIINNSQDVANINFLNDIAQLRMSASLIPDITRICLIKDIELEKIQIKQPSITPVTRYSLYFLAYQVDLQMQSKIPDDSTVLQDLADDLKKSTSKIKEALGKFWTDSDDDHRSLKDIWNLIIRTNQQLSNALLTYPHSQLIKSIRDEYYTNTLRAHSKLRKTPYSALQQINNPVGTSFAFLKSKPESTQLEVDDEPVERYFIDKEKCALYPVIIASIVIYLLVIAYTLYFDGISILYHKEIADDYCLEQDVINTTTALTDELLTSADSDFTQPSLQQIIDTIGVTSTEANIIRGHFVRETDMPNTERLLLDLRHVDTQPIIGIENCQRISFLMMIHEVSVRTIDNNTRKCYTYQLSNNVDMIYNAVNRHRTERQDIIRRQKEINFPLFIAFALFTIVIWVPAIINIKREKKVLLHAVRRATAFYEHRCEYADSTTFDNCAPFLYILIMLVLLVINVFLYFIIISNDEDHLQAHLYQLISIGKIGTLYQEAFALAMFTFPIYSEEEDKEFYIDLLRKICENITSLVDEFITMDDNSITSVPILDNGSEKNMFLGQIREFSQLLKKGEFAVDSFNLLYARYLAMLHLSRIHSEVIPTMASYTKRCMVETPCEFWFLSMAIIIVATLSLVLIYKYFEWNSQWIKSASLIIRCAMFDDNELIRSVLNILEREHPNYIDDFPFPAIVRRKDGAIVMCNTKLLSFTPHSKTQIIGQRVENLFGPLDKQVKITNKKGEDITLEVEIDSGGSDHEVIMFKDITDICSANLQYKTLVDRLTPAGLKLPTREVLYLFKVRITKPLTSEDFADMAEKEGPLNIIRLVVTGSTYVGAAKPDVDVKNIIEFITHILAPKISEPEKSIIAAVVKGEVSIVPLVGSSVPALCGITAEKAFGKIVNGEFGSIYVEQEMKDALNDFDVKPLTLNLYD